MQDIELCVCQGRRESASKGGDRHEAGRWICSRVRLQSLAVGILGVLASTSVLASQEPKQNSSLDSGFVLRQTVRRVRVDVVVTDAKGNPVTGLKASDFRVAEDGKP